MGRHDAGAEAGEEGGGAGDFVAGSGSPRVPAAAEASAFVRARRTTTDEKAGRRGCHRRTAGMSAQGGTCPPYRRTLVGDEVAAGAEEGEAVLEEAREGGDGSAYDQVVGCFVRRLLAGELGTGVEDGEVGEAELAGGEAEEVGALADGFDEGVMGGGAGDGEDEAGEAAAGADVGDALSGGDLADQKDGERVEEVLDGYLAGFGDGGEAGAGVVGEEEVEVGEVGAELVGGDGEAELVGGGEEGVGEGGVGLWGWRHGGSLPQNDFTAKPQRMQRAESPGPPEAGRACRTLRRPRGAGYGGQAAGG